MGELLEAIEPGKTQPSKPVKLPMTPEMFSLHLAGSSDCDAIHDK